MVILCSWAMALQISRRAAVGVTPQHAPCTSHVVVEKKSAFKTKMVKSTSHQMFSISSQSRGFVHGKSRTRIGYWNVHSVGSLSDQSDKLLSVIDTMKLKKIGLLALSESHWPGN